VAEPSRKTANASEWSWNFSPRSNPLAYGMGVVAAFWAYHFLFADYRAIVVGGAVFAAAAASKPVCLLAYLVPGLGHFYLRRWHKGLVFLGAILTLFALGVVMDARLVKPQGWGDPLAVLRWIAQMAMGLPYFITHGLGFGIEENLVKSVTHEYGSTFTEAAGLLNVLVILDAYDIAVGRKS